MDLAALLSSGHLRLQHIVLCQALAASGTLREAAALLHRTQPAVTKMLQELESSLGVKLFERGRFGTQPTAAGAAFIERTLVMLNEWDATLEELQAFGSGEGALLRVGATPLTTLGLLPQALVRVRTERPGLLVRIREASIHELLLALEAGELDCVVGRYSGELLGTEALGRLRQERLYDEVLSVVSGPDHPLVDRRRVTWQDLAAADWVLPPAELATRQNFSASFIRKALVPPRPLYESSSYATSVSFANQLGVLALVPMEAARLAEARGLVRVLRIALTAFSAPISILQRRNSAQSKGLGSFLKALRAVAGAREGLLSGGHRP